MDVCDREREQVIVCVVVFWGRLTLVFGNCLVYLDRTVKDYRMVTEQRRIHVVMILYHVRWCLSHRQYYLGPRHHRVTHSLTSL